MTMEQQVSVLNFLKELGIEAHAVGTMVGVNRTSMCQFFLDRSGKLPEENVYPQVLEFLEFEFNCDSVRLYWAGKTDEDLFLENLKAY